MHLTSPFTPHLYINRPRLGSPILSRAGKGKASAALAIAAGLCIIRTMAETPVNVPEVTRFVRNVLGCNCGDEVFRSIQVTRGSSAVKACSAEYEFRIGGRLLIVITSALGEATSAAELEKVVAEGKRAPLALTVAEFRA